MAQYQITLDSQLCISLFTGNSQNAGVPNPNIDTPSKKFDHPDLN
ncbi:MULTISPECIES: hypothetical protein [Paenibacillus]|jgi:hypothetical protein|nr:MULTISPECIES: hypothetical protein [Paenibacillus]